jgi:hypothetical protein
MPRPTAGPGLVARSHSRTSTSACSAAKAVTTSLALGQIGQSDEVNRSIRDTRVLLRKQVTRTERGRLLGS